MSIYKKLREMKRPGEALASKLATPTVASKKPQSVASHTATSLEPRPRYSGERARVAHVQWNTRVYFDLAVEVDAFLKTVTWSKQEFTERAFRHMLDHIASHESDTVARHTTDNLASHTAPVASVQAHDELMILRTDDKIIIMYEQWTDNRFNIRDDAIAKDYNNYDPRIIEAAILQAILRKKGAKINAFAYFVDPIAEMVAAEMSENGLRGFVQRLSEKVTILKSSPGWRRRS